MTSETVSSESSGNASDLIATLLHRSPRIAMAAASAQFAWPLVKRAHTKVKERRTYTVKVPATDEIYDDLHEWVLGLLPTDEQRALVAWTSKRDDLGPTAAYPGSSGPPKPPRIRLRYDGSREQMVTIGGHRIKVVINDGEAYKDDGRWKPAELMFTMHSLGAQQALLQEMAQVAKRSREEKRQPVFRMLDKWGDWARVDDLPVRDLDSVILADGQLDRLVADVADFLEREGEYARRCIPWHRGHLYEGPPGTGKTSVARAIASHFTMDVWYLPLADITKDCNLLNAISRITPRSMLLLEDVDVFHAATQRDENAGVTLSGLLNALDGIATPHGLLTVLTTNTPEVLDKAVVRPGRVDLVEHFGFATADQVARLLSRWYDCPVHPAAVSPMDSVPPAQIVEVCKRSATIDDAWRELDKLKANSTSVITPPIAVGFRTVGEPAQDRESYRQLSFTFHSSRPSEFRVQLSVDGVEAESDPLPYDADNDAANDARLQAISRWEEKTGRVLPADARAWLPIEMVAF
jgi:hypothetical protein